MENNFDRTELTTRLRNRLRKYTMLVGATDQNYRVFLTSVYPLPECCYYEHE